MNEEKKKRRSGEQYLAWGEDKFEKLSDDVIVDIFSRLNDAKFLTQSLLISKRFASLIPTITTVSAKIIIDSTNPNYNSELIQYDSVRVNYVATSSSSLSSWKGEAELRQLKLWEEKIAVDDLAGAALHSFTKLEKAIIEYPFFDKYTCDSDGVGHELKKWMVEYSGGNRSYMKSCALVVANQLLFGTDVDRTVNRILNWVGRCCKFAQSVHATVGVLAQEHESLHDICITGKYRLRNWIHAGEEEIMKTKKMRQNNNNNNLVEEEEDVYMKVKVWHVPLPTPGLLELFSIKGVSFVVATTTTTSYDDDDDIDEAARRFWDCCNDKPGKTGTDFIQEAVTGMRTVVETMMPNCTMDIQAHWFWKDK